MMLDTIQRYIVEVLGTVLLIVVGVLYIRGFVTGDMPLDNYIYISGLVVALAMMGFPVVIRSILGK